MIRYLFALLFTCYAFAAKPEINGSFIGISGGQNQAVSVDLGITMFTAGYSSWGFHVAADSRQYPDNYSHYEANKALWNTNQTYETKSTGYSVGPFMNVGRFFVAAGVSVVNQKMEQRVIWQDGTTEAHQNANNNLIKPYVKMGYVFKRFTIYGGYSQHYGTTAGIGFAF
jgi:hypothetical protein